MSRLDELERLLSEATPLPWRTTLHHGSLFVEPSGRNPLGKYVCEVGPPEGEQVGVDAALIAASVNTLPALLRLARAASKLADYWDPRGADEWNDLRAELAELGVKIRG